MVRTATTTIVISHQRCFGGLLVAGSQNASASNCGGPSSASSGSAFPFRPVRRLGSSGSSSPRTKKAPGWFRSTPESCPPAGLLDIVSFPSWVGSRRSSLLLLLRMACGRRRRGFSSLPGVVVGATGAAKTVPGGDTTAFLPFWSCPFRLKRYLDGGNGCTTIPGSVASDAAAAGGDEGPDAAPRADVLVAGS